MNSDQSSWLFVDDLQRIRDRPTRIGVDLRLGGHPMHAVFDFERADLIELVELPWLLSNFHVSQKAVIELANRFYAGEDIALPVDLSELAADDAAMVFDPVRKARAREAAARVGLQVEELSQSGTYPVLFSGRLRVDGVPVILRVELYNGVGRIPVMQWLRGSKPEGLSDDQEYAIELMLVERVQAT